MNEIEKKKEGETEIKRERERIRDLRREEKTIFLKL